MLNPFPELLYYSMLAPFILRVVAGFIFIDLGILAFKTERTRWIVSLTAIRIPNPKLAVKILGLVQLVCGFMFIIGYYTQIAGIILAILTFAEAFIEYKEPAMLKRNIVFYIMLFAITLSLVFSGAGSFAFDLPL
jgi:uncharacterized membrane protein YphA (DoxX/SURF4 family)